jgi:histidine decarboxylase
VVLTRRSYRDRVARIVPYIGGVDATIAGSRSGHTVLQLWWAVHSVGLEGHRRRALEACRTAMYAERELAAIGWPAWRHSHASTVVIARPPDAVVERWSLASTGEHSHLITTPGVTRGMVHDLLADLRGSTPVAPLRVPISSTPGSTSAVPDPPSRSSS